MKTDNINIIKNENYIRIQKLSHSHVMSKELSYNTIADYSFIKKEGCIYQFSNEVPKIYKTYINWKKSVKRLFNIEID